MNTSWQDRVLRQFLDDRVDAPDETTAAPGGICGYLLSEGLSQRLALAPRPRPQPATRAAAPAAEPVLAAAGKGSP